MSTRNYRMITVERTGDVALVRAKDGKSFAAQDVDRLRDELFGLCAEMPRIVLDLSNVLYLSEAGLAALLYMRRRAVDAKGQVRLCNVRMQAKSRIETTKVESLLDIFPDESAALANW